MAESLVINPEKLITLPGQWLVIGSGSMVGSRFVEVCGPSSKLYGAGRKELDFNNRLLKDFQEMDVTNFDQVFRVVDQSPAQYIINFAGAALVDQMEKERPSDPNDQQQLNENNGYRINVLGTRNIVEACKKVGKVPIFISTESVFDGKNGPYSEDDQIVNSLDGVSWYGFTKALAEREVTKSGTPFLMIRISYPYRRDYPLKGDFARNFLKLYDSVQAGEKQWYPIFADQYLSPTLIDDLAPAVLTLIDKEAQGIYHLTSPQAMTPYQFCCQLLKVARGMKDPQGVIPKGSIVKFQAEHQDLAKRPVRAVLKASKIIKAGFTPTSWEDGIKIYTAA